MPSQSTRDKVLKQMEDTFNEQDPISLMFNKMATPPPQTDVYGQAQGQVPSSSSSGNLSDVSTALGASRAMQGVTDRQTSQQQATLDHLNDTIDFLPEGPDKDAQQKRIDDLTQMVKNSKTSNIIGGK